MFPVLTVSDALTCALAALIAIASKYLLAFHKKHLFNPAVFAGITLSLLGSGNVAWWIGTWSMFIPSVIIGFLIVRKIRRFKMFFAFIIGSLVAVAVIEYLNPANPKGFIDLFSQVFLSWPLIFFGTIMLTEPLTSPSRHRDRLIYGGLVGALSSIPFHFGPIYSTPEMALLVGNIYSWIVSPKGRLRLKLLNKKEIAKNIYEFSFISEDYGQKFIAGQYMEWTLDHNKPDSRGERRYFTIASSPTESDIKVGIKIGEKRSSYKEVMFNMKEGDRIVAGNVSGEFILPEKNNSKAVFIAGGIGITPFRSMLKYLIDTGNDKKIKTTLFYAASTEEEIAYKEIFTEAESSIGLKTVYVVGKFIDAELLKDEVVDYRENIYYISGPNAMVDNYKNLLKSLGINHKNIITDYFPGY